MLTFGIMLENIQKYLKIAAVRYDLLFASLIIFVLMIILIPIPSALIDSLLTLSISISIVILVAVIFSEKPLDFSSFPTVLLLATLLRLSVNIASTRAILINGHIGTLAAGHIIETFGMFVMSGSLIVGVIIFSILTIINFIVITKGAGRIAEVSARFSLDAMPGKQMSIDADLSAGIINEETAKSKRAELEEESTFFGAMDGASKFVRGDAIAGIMITFVNFLGGSIVGVIEKKMLFTKALQTYTILTIGDGLVSQIPSLIVSVAAGLLVSKGRMEGSTEKAILKQIAKDPKSLGLTSAFLLLIGLMPGMPAMPFFIISTIMLSSVYMRIQDTKTKKAEEKALQEKLSSQAETYENQVKHDLIKIELGSQILSLAHKDGNLKNQINAMKREFINELGFVIPQTRIQDNFLIGGQEYFIKIRGITCAKGELYCNMLLVMTTDELHSLNGKKVLEPVFSLPAIWINEFDKQKAVANGYIIADPPTVLVTHLRETIKENIEELVTYSSVQNLIANIGEEYQKMAGEIIPSQITVNTLQKVIQMLLSESISIRDLPKIIECTAEAYKANQNLAYVTEYVRMNLSKQISNFYASDKKIIRVVVLSQKWENEFLKNINVDGSFAVSPDNLKQFMTELKPMLEKHSSEEKNVLLCKPMLRTHIRDIVRKLNSNMPVLSQNEIHSKYSIEIIAHV